MLTASGLTFVGGTDDFRFRAFATATGDKLWEIKMPSSIETTPITYMGSDGRQFVTVVSTGGGLTGSEVTNDEIIAFALPARTAQPAPDRATVAQRIVGTWQLMSRTVRHADGKAIVDPVLGEKPTGRLVYDANGPMMLQMMRADRKEPISTPSNPRDKTNARVVLGYDSYFGRYTVDEKAGTVTHHVEGSLFPEDLGSDWVRPFTLEGDTLTLKLTSPADGLTRTLVFQRVR